MEILRRTWRLEATVIERIQAYAELEPLWLGNRLPSREELQDALAAAEPDVLAEAASYPDHPRYPDRLRLEFLGAFASLCEDIARDVSRESPLLAAFFFRQAMSSDLSLAGLTINDLGMSFRQLSRACTNLLRILDVTMDHDPSLASRLGITAPVQRELFDAFIDANAQPGGHADFLQRMFHEPGFLEQVPRPFVRDEILNAETVERVRSVCRDLARSAISIDEWLDNEAELVEEARALLAKDGSRDPIAEFAATFSSVAQDEIPTASVSDSSLSKARLTFGNQRLASALYALQLGTADLALTLASEGLVEGFKYWYDPSTELVALDPFGDGEYLPLVPIINSEGIVIDPREGLEAPPVAHRLTLIRLLVVYLQAAGQLGQDVSADPIADQFMQRFTRAHHLEWESFDSHPNYESEVVDPDIWVAHRLATPWSLPVEARWAAALERDLLVRGAALSGGRRNLDPSTTAPPREPIVRRTTGLAGEKIDQILSTVKEFHGAFSLYETDTRRDISDVRNALNAGEIRRGQSNRFLREAIRHWDALQDKTQRELDNAEAAYREIMAGTSVDGAPRQTAIALGVAFEVERRRNRGQVLPGESDFTALRNNAAHPEGPFGLFELERMRALLFGLGTRNDGILEMLAGAAARKDRR